MSLVHSEINIVFDRRKVFSHIFISYYLSAIRRSLIAELLLSTSVLRKLIAYLFHARFRIFPIKN